MTSVVQGGLQGVRMYDIDPLFANPNNPAGEDGIFGTSDDGLKLQSSSPVIDSGTTWINYEYSDILGYPRRSSNVQDYGAYEQQKFDVDYEELYSELKKGGYILLFRHGMTDWTQTDQPGYREDLSDCSLQRNLAVFGRDQVYFLGEAIRLLEIPVDTSFGSEMCRCKETGLAISGTFKPAFQWMSDEPEDSLAKVVDLGTLTKAGLNSVIVSHMNVIEIVTSFPKGEVNEGDVVVIKPLGGNNFEEIAQLTTDTWEKMLEYLPASPVSVNGEDITPSGFVLYENYPNPFNPSTTIEFNIPSSQHVKLKVIDMLGREVALLVDEFRNSGRYQVVFNASDLASGIYFYTLEAGTFNQTKKLTLIK